VVNPADILTPEQLAQRLQVPRGWIVEKCRTRCQNPIPFFRIGRYVRFSWPAVASWLESTSTAK
jgi:excisionase family DNA binding protein